jgi:FixJ family two-component response regulator
MPRSHQPSVISVFIPKAAFVMYGRVIRADCRVSYNANRQWENVFAWGTTAFRQACWRSPRFRISTLRGDGSLDEKPLRSAPLPVVFIVDDDPSVRGALSSLVRSIGLRVETFTSAQEFFGAKRPDAVSCLIVDVRLPGLSGLDFQAELTKARIQIPIIFITGHGDIPMSVKAMKAGAIEFLTKPFRDQDLLDAIRVALERGRASQANEKAISELRAKYQTLTPREQEVMGWVTGGLLNKQVAAEIGVTEITVKVHRGKVTRKMGAKSLADLVKMADILGIRRTRS